MCRSDRSYWYGKYIRILFLGFAASAMAITCNAVIPHRAWGKCCKTFKNLQPAGKVEPLRIFVLAGQSNAVGYNHISQLAPDYEQISRINESTEGVLFWPGSNANPLYANQWISLKAGVSDISVSEPYKDGCFGPETGFALALRKAMPDEEIAIIKFALGATGIARSVDYDDYIPSLKGFSDNNLNWHPPSDGREAGTLYTDLIKNIYEALEALDAKGISYTIGGIIWMQGEHEAGISRQMALDYGKLLTLFQQTLLKDLNVRKIPFLVGEINSHTWAFGDLARKSQAEACRKIAKCALIKTTDLPRGGIGGEAHFDAKGMLLLGERFAAGYLSLLNRKSHST